MPTEICGVLLRKREAEQEYRLNASVMLVSPIVALVNVVLLFADPTLAQAVAQMGQF